jgi:hypothetical protein
VNNAHRSGTWLALVGTRRWICVPSEGRLSSTAIAIPQTTYRAGGENASDRSQIATATL